MPTERQKLPGRILCNNYRWCSGITDIRTLLAYLSYCAQMDLDAKNITVFLRDVEARDHDGDALLLQRLGQLVGQLRGVRVGHLGSSSPLRGAAGAQ